jgi:hypothetical protein
MRVYADCAICSEPGVLYEIFDIVRPWLPDTAEKVGELGLCEPCRDLIGSGWAMVQVLGQGASV